MIIIINIFYPKYKLKLIKNFTIKKFFFLKKIVLLINIINFE
jgi:hypothetical protein